MKYLSKITIFLFALTAFFTTPSFAHTYHTSLTRIDFNSAEKTLEIEVNLFNHDIEKVLESKYKKRVDFDNANELDKMLFDYLNENFLIKDSNDKSEKLVWVGKEIKNDMMTVFVEFDNVGKIENLKLLNNIFLGNFKDQTNLITIHSGEKKYDLVFRSGDDFKDLISDKNNKR